LNKRGRSQTGSTGITYTRAKYIRQATIVSEVIRDNGVAHRGLSQCDLRNRTAKRRNR
jgi:hypothetical protein